MEDQEIKPQPLRGRGSDSNPANRFVGVAEVREADGWEWQPDSAPETEVNEDHTRSILTRNDSPDLGFEFSVNPYRGCEHGCIYCYARPTHEYLGLSAGLDFETKLFAKYRAAELLRVELAKKSWSPQTVVMSGVTDCYQPIERKLRITRACLEVLRDFSNPVAVITKNALVARDKDILLELARKQACCVTLSITTLDADLARVLEPRAASPRRRIATLKELSSAGIPVSVNVAPVIPGITDSEIPAILKAAWDAGARSAGYTILRLPFAVAPLFEAWLGHHFPERKAKVLSRIRQMRGGKLNEPKFGSRMRGEGIFAEQIRNLFYVTVRRLGFEQRGFDLSTAHFHVPDDGPQLSWQI